MNARVPLDARLVWPPMALAAALTLAFASPALVGAGTFAAPSDEGHLTTLIVEAFAGVGASLTGAAVAVLTFGRRSPLRERLDRFVAAGLSPAEAAAGPLALSIAALAAVSALFAAVVVVVLRARVHLGEPSLRLADALGTAWGVGLSTACWTSLALAIVAARGARRWPFALVALDVVGRAVPGAASWLHPASHVANVLGAPPPSGTVAAPVVPQLGSVAVLLAVVAVAWSVARARYRGAIAAGSR
jgi:hypothetical protein